jgi:aspartate aminotransferase-like enzyme
MFGPNVSTNLQCSVDFHHREKRFADVHKEILALFRHKFEVPSSYEIIVYTGSGTLAVESFISAFKGTMRVDSHDIDQEKFANRWRGLLKHYGKFDESSDHSIKVLFETSRSQYNGDANATFVDAVSGFPFWPTPKSSAWCTVSSKLLGAAPVLSVLVINREFMQAHLEDSPSYLNPFKYLEYQKVGETPFTPAMPLFVDFLKTLRAFDVVRLREQVAANYTRLVQVIGVENLVNTELSPVLTVKPGVVSPEVVARWTLYGNKQNGQVQIFLYSESDDNYEKLARDIAESKSSVWQADPQAQSDEGKRLSPLILI